MNNQPPVQEPAGPSWSGGWRAWLQQVFECLRWKRSFNYTLPIDFGSVAAQAQAGVIVAIPGVRQGDAAQVTPYADVAGMTFAGVVTADDMLTVYAKNFSAGAIDPASQAFRIIVLQN